MSRRPTTAWPRQAFPTAWTLHPTCPTARCAALAMPTQCRAQAAHRHRRPPGQFWSTASEACVMWTTHSQAGAGAGGQLELRPPGLRLHAGRQRGDAAARIGRAQAAGGRRRRRRAGRGGGRPVRARRQRHPRVPGRQARPRASWPRAGGLPAATSPRSGARLWCPPAKAARLQAGDEGQACRTPGPHVLQRMDQLKQGLGLPKHLLQGPALGAAQHSGRRIGDHN